MITFVSGKSDAGDYFAIRKASVEDAARMAPIVNASYFNEESAFFEGQRTNEENIKSMMQSSSVSDCD